MIICDRLSTRENSPVHAALRQASRSFRSVCSAIVPIAPYRQTEEASHCAPDDYVAAMPIVLTSEIFAGYRQCIDNRQWTVSIAGSCEP